MGFRQCNDNCKDYPGYLIDGNPTVVFFCMNTSQNCMIDIDLVLFCQKILRSKTAFPNTKIVYELYIFHIHFSQEIPPCWYKSITKTMQLWIISLAWASVLEGCFYLEIYSLTILLQYLIPKINN